MKKYKSVKEYFLTLKFRNKYHRIIKFEQGEDESFYIKWNLRLAKNKDGNYSCRSYISYHSKYSPKNQGYKVHSYGCGGNRIRKSETYRKKFITEYKKHFFEYNLNNISESIKISNPNQCDIVFEMDDINNYTILLFSDKRADLLKNDYENMSSQKINLLGYFLIVSLFLKLKFSPLGHSPTGEPKLREI